MADQNLFVDMRFECLLDNWPVEKRALYADARNIDVFLRSLEDKVRGFQILSGKVIKSKNKTDV